MEYTRQGYLNSDFRLFHILDQKKKEFEFHYHDFDKLVILIQGNVSYSIEGKTYPLKPYDIILVQHNEIHKPIIHDDSTYERIIVYISPSFLSDYKAEKYDLGYCFEKAKDEHTNLLRLHSIVNHPLLASIQKLEQSFLDDHYAFELYRKISFLEFMVQLNRAVIHHSLDYMHNEAANPKILRIIQYIHQNLTHDISVDTIAKETYMSKYHMMRTFKAETGYTIHEYISQKRLLLARELLNQQIPITQVCYDCGFKDYSSFLRAYKKQFNRLPTENRKKGYLSSPNNRL